MKTIITLILCLMVTITQAQNIVGKRFLLNYNPELGSKSITLAKFSKGKFNRAYYVYYFDKKGNLSLQNKKRNPFKNPFRKPRGICGMGIPHLNGTYTFNKKDKAVYIKANGGSLGFVDSDYQINDTFKIKKIKRGVFQLIDIKNEKTDSLLLSKIKNNLLTGKWYLKRNNDIQTNLYGKDNFWYFANNIKVEIPTKKVAYDYNNKVIPSNYDGFYSEEQIINWDGSLMIKQSMNCYHTGDSHGGKRLQSIEENEYYFQTISNDTITLLKKSKVKNMLVKDSKFVQIAYELITLIKQE